MDGLDQAFFKYDEPCPPHLFRGYLASITPRVSGVPFPRPGSLGTDRVSIQSCVCHLIHQASDDTQGWSLLKLPLQRWLEPGLLCFLGSGSWC